MMPPQKHASVRYNKSRPATLMPFRLDTSLVALRYDQTAQAEPPIPIPPAKSPLRYQRVGTGAAGTGVSASVSVSAGAGAGADAASTRPASCTSNPGSAAVSTRTQNHISTPIIIAPPFPPPTGPLPRPPTADHPAFRAAPATGRTDIDDPKRDSGHAPTTSSNTQTFYEESSEDEDPFPYEKLDTIHTGRRSKFVPSLLVPPLRIRSSSPTSLYSENERSEYRLTRNSSGATSNSQCSIALSQTLPSPGLSEANTVSPTSPTTPPLPSDSHFPDKTTTSSIFSRRSFSFRTSVNPMKTAKRLKKKHPPHPQLHPHAVVEGHSGVGEHSVRALAGAPKEANAPAASPKEEAKTATSSPGVNVAPPPDGDEQSQTGTEIQGFGSSGSASSDRARPSHSPNLSTGAPVSGGGDDFADFVQQISFSKRGSIMLGGKRPSKHHATMSGDSGIAEQQPASPVKGKHAPRAFALASSPSKSALSKSQIDGVAASVLLEEGDEPTVPERPLTPPPLLNAESPATPQSLQHPPSIRLISPEVERESQKVRSLYESVEGLRWEDGGRVSSFGERLEPTVEVPSDADENASKPSSTSTPNQSTNPTDRPSSLTPALGIPESAAPSVSPQDELPRRTFELAGGIEDWDDVQAEEVDRYGFIAPRRPMTPSSAPPTVMDSPKSFSSRKNRNRKDGPQYSRFLGTGRGPSRKGSARSLHTQASGYSATSRRSTRSAIRQAANLLPHNKDRRWMDEAGNMLAQQPGLTSIGDDISANKLADEYTRKESSRTEKWRKMAKVVKRGKDGEGMVFEFDTKHPKLIERTWKGIPDRWRAAAWYSFLSTSARNSKKPFPTEDELFAKYHLLQEQPSPDDVQIDLDVPRTISQHIMFRRRYRGGQRLLFRVLHALSLHFPVTGYVQGMASLAATLLSYYDEERCFVMLVRLWELRGLNRLYSPNFVELMECLQDFEKYWLAEKDVAKSLKELCIDPTAYGTRWYLTLFHLSIPFSSQLRIWDVFMLLGASPPDLSVPGPTSGKQVTQAVSSKGLEILHATSTAIILALSEHIIDSEFENAMKALTSFVPVKNDELLMKVVGTEYKQHTGKSKKA